MRRHILLCTVGLAVGAPATHAQVVRGVVAEVTTDVPLEGAMVIVQELDGTVAHRVLSDASGSFIARVAHPGVYRIRVDRIGYESLTTAHFDVPVQGTFQNIQVPIRPVELTGIDVRGSRRCKLRPEQGAATARVWEEARKALEAAAWTLSSGAYRYTLLQYERTLEPDRRTVTDESRRFVRGTGQAPYVSAPVEDLVTTGFIRENDDRTLTYFAPDAEALLADPFLNTHCMRLDDAKDGQVGLAFEPVRGRRMPDIRGTLWIDMATATLKRLEFSYVNLPGDYDRGSPGGTVVFGRLPNGTWIVRDWSIVMPMLATDPRRIRTFIRGYLQEGGAVWRVVDGSGTFLLEAMTASVWGTVMDSTDARPLGGASLRAEGGGDSATTLGAGTFLLPGLAPGLQHIEVRHPSLDTLGLGPVAAQVEAPAGEITPVQIRVPGVGEVAARTCAAGPVPEGETSTLLGRVRRGDAPGAGALVRLRWLGGTRRQFEVTDRAAPGRHGLRDLRWAADPLDDRWLFTTLDERGIFILCGVPAGSQVRVEVADGTAPPTVRTATLPHGNPLVTLLVTLKESPEP